MKKIGIIILTAIIINPFSSVVFAQTGESSSGGVLGGISQILTLNNPVQFDNPSFQFENKSNPSFILLIPEKNQDNINSSRENSWKEEKEDITVSLVWKENNQAYTVLIKKTDEGRFELSFKDKKPRLGNYRLDVTARETLIYTRTLTLDFIWGDPSRFNKKPQGRGFMKDFLEENPDYQNYEVVKRDRNSVHFKRPDGKIEAQFSDAAINYQDNRGNWQPIDTKLQKRGNEYVGSGTSVKIKNDGTVLIDGKNYSHKTIAFGLFNPETKQFISLKNFAEGLPDENKLVRKTNQYKHEITLLDNGLKEELTFFENPLTGLEAQEWLVLESIITGITLPDGWIDEFSEEELNFSLPTAEDANGDIPITRRYAQIVDGKQYVYTGIPVSWFATAVYPVVVDPDFTSVAVDAEVWGYNSVYATARSTATGSNTTSTQYTGQTFASNNYQINRTFLKFDTSSITEVNTVDYANLKLTATGDESTTDFDVQIVKQNWSAQDPISSSNRDAAFDGSLAGTADDNIWRNTAGMSTNTQYTSGNLSGAWINRTGATYYSLRSSRDYNGTTPTGAERVRIALSENATAGYRPVLSVVYVVGATPTPTPTATPTPTPTPTPTSTPTPTPTPSGNSVKMDGINMGGVKIN